MVRLRYKAPDGDESRLSERAAVDGGARFAASSENFRFAAAVAEFGMLLRDSPHRGRSSFDHVVNVARASQGEDADGYRAEFVRLVEACKSIKPELAIDD